MYNDSLLKQAFIDGYKSAMCEANSNAVLGEVADIETASEPIQNALYATGRFSKEQCTQLADGILQYIKDYGLIILKKI